MNVMISARPLRATGTQRAKPDGNTAPQACICAAAQSAFVVRLGRLVEIQVVAIARALAARVRELEENIKSCHKKCMKK